MSEIKLDDVLKVKKEALKLRDSVISAKATLVEVDKNLAACRKELKELGVDDPEKAEEIIAKLNEKIEKLFEDANSKLEKWL